MSTRGFYRSLAIPAPRRLMNTSLSDVNLPIDYARRIENMVPVKGAARTLGKRNGMSDLGVAIAWGTTKKVMYYVNSSGDTELFAYQDDDSTARIYRSTDDGASWSSVKTGLTTGGVVFSDVMDNNLCIVNGLDNNMYWDGSAITDMGEYVTDQTSSETQNSTSQIEFIPFKGSDHDYADGTLIKVTFDTAGEVSATVTGTPSYDSGTGILTVNVTGTPFPSPSETITTIKYFDKPPVFGFIKTAHDRLWALPGGQWKAKTRKDPSTSLYVYFTDISNSVNAWFDADTQEVSFINMEDKHGFFDEFVGISQLDGFMAFHGREVMQIWTGVDPSENGDFSWAKNIPVGTLAGASLQQVGNDVAFFTKYGIRTLRNVVSFERLELGSDIGAEIDPTVQEQIDTALASDANYRNITSWTYEREGWYGFSASGNHLVYVINEDVQGWVIFSGAFQDIRTVVDLPDGTLIGAQDDQLKIYSNGVDGEDEAYSDDGSAYLASWETQWIDLPKRWANNHIEIILQSGAPEQTMILNRFTDNIPNQSKRYELTIDSSFPEWDVADWDEAFWTAEDPVVKQRDKFIAHSIAYQIQTNNTLGPFEVVKLNLGGR